MSDITIRVEGLGKRYHIGRAQQRHDTLRDAVVAGLRGPLDRLRSRGQRGDEPQTMDDAIWALKDVTFDVRRGEVLGIIGRNGAGKSTLLKILSRITEPTEGRAEIHGRVGSLLEVGTGFHPELTGRENIQLNGAILGMRRAEIDRRFDEIVAFAEIERFLDTPVKRYSSGMYVRLAFAVAAHLEPEVLLVDEVLAVGDAAFQKKCLGKMGEVAREGRTVFFVSHNMGSVQTLCKRGLVLSNGVIRLDAGIERAIMDYLGEMEVRSSRKIGQRNDRGGRGEARLIDLSIGATESGCGALQTGRPACFVFQTDRLLPGLSVSFTFYNSQGCQLANFHSAVHGPEDLEDRQLGSRFVCQIDELNLVPGHYRINIALYTLGELQDHVEAAGFFDVEPGAVRGRPVNKPSGYGDVCFPHRWRLPLH